MAKKRITVVAIDDHQLLIEGIIRFLEIDPKIHIVGCKYETKSFLDLIKKKLPDIALVDIGLRQGDKRENGIELVPEIIKLSENTKVIILSGYNSAEYVIPAVKSGIRGYVLKENRDELIEAIHTVAAGGTFFSESINKIILDYFQNPKKMKKGDTYEPTPKEKIVLKFICNGMTNAQIAEELSRGIETINSHRKNIMSKANVNNAAALVLWAKENGYC